MDFVITRDAPRLHALRRWLWDRAGSGSLPVFLGDRLDQTLLEATEHTVTSDWIRVADFARQQQEDHRDRPFPPPELRETDPFN
jgi:hypothetical protein